MRGVFDQDQLRTTCRKGQGIGCEAGEPANQAWDRYVRLSEVTGQDEYGSFC